MSRDEAWSFGIVTKHSTILIFAGLSFIAMGISIQYYTPGGPYWEAVIMARRFLDLKTWSWLFIGAGVLVTIFSHWPNRARTWGYTILTGYSVGWSMFYFVGAGTTSSTHLMFSLSTGFVWLFQGFVWYIISGMPAVAATGKGRKPIWTGWRKKS